ncbi:RNA polymerase factor sigma-54 [mine drainage metagenome]|uniref:RNA polymerase factor sigma-54 n=1 Tax=mine drainage metagenome TaxID=410659 RepID=A0A1J5SWU3_9ZZZZ
MQHHNNKIEAALLGKIVLARFLELPLRAFDRLAVQAESSIVHNGMHQWVTVGRLEGAQAVHDATGILQTQSSPILGEVHEAGRNLTFLYHRDSCTREYRFDEEGVNYLMSRPDFPAEWAGILRRLRLINTRNRLTHALMQAVLTSQAEYLRSGLGLALLPLTQAEISARLISGSNLSVVADPGRISRLVRGLSIMLPNRKVVPLNTLFPKPRQVHCHFVDHVIKTEKVWMAERVLREPLTDKAIADILEREYGIRLLRRTVANIRHDLAIPDCRNRSHRINYLAATEEFSALVPLTPQALRTAVPAHPGVYEIRAVSASSPDGEKAAWPGKSMPPTPHGVVYIGSTGDLRKRLGDHLRGNSDNALLHNHVADGAARVRFRLISDEWRLAERELYRVFCETFGAPPLCNRMSP